MALLPQQPGFGTFWWTNLPCGGFSQSISVSPINSHTTNCCTFIYHPTICFYIVSVLTALFKYPTEKKKKSENPEEV
jgi:hypothetical protein